MNIPYRITELEKAELHCHIDGLLNLQMLKDLRDLGHEPGISAAQLRKVLPVRSFEDWLGPYMAACGPAFEPKEEKLAIMLEQHIKNLKQQNVRYAEIMVSGLLNLAGELGLVLEVFRQLRERSDKVAGDDFQVEFVVTVGRTTKEKLIRRLDRAIEIGKAGLAVGVALTASEDFCSIEDVADKFKQAKDAGLGIEIHAGELRDPQSVWDVEEFERIYKNTTAASFAR